MDYADQMNDGGRLTNVELRNTIDPWVTQLPIWNMLGATAGSWKA